MKLSFKHNTQFSFDKDAYYNSHSSRQLLTMNVKMGQYAFHECDSESQGYESDNHINIKKAI